MATTTTLSAPSFCSDETVLTMMVDSGATHNFVDPLLTPRLKEFMSDDRVLNVPQHIVGIGEHVLKALSPTRTTLSHSWSMNTASRSHNRKCLGRFRKP